MTDKEFILTLRANISQFTKAMGQAKGASNIFTGSLMAGVAAGNLLSGAVAKVSAQVVRLGQDVIGFDTKMRRMQINASLSTAEMLAMKDKIITTSIATKNTKEDVANLADEFLKESKDIKFVNDNLDYTAKLMKASGVSGVILGKSMGTLKEETNLSNEEFQSLTKTLYSFGKQKGVEMNFAEIMPQAGELVQSYKRRNPKASLKEITDYLVKSMFVGNPQAVSNAYRAMVLKPARAEMKQLGFNISKGVLPSVDEILKKLRTLPEGMRRLSASAIFGKSGDAILKLINDVDGLTEAQSKIKLDDIFTDNQIAAGDFSSALTGVHTAIFALADKTLGPYIADLTKYINELTKDPEKIKRWAGYIKDAAVVLGTLYAGVKALQLLGLVLNVAGAVKGKGKGGGLGALGSSPANPMYVVTVGGGVPGVGGAAGGAGAMGLLSKLTIGTAVGLATFEATRWALKQSGGENVLEKLGGDIYKLLHPEQTSAQAALQAAIQSRNNPQSNSPVTNVEVHAAIDGEDVAVKVKKKMVRVVKGGVTFMQAAES